MDKNIQVKKVPEDVHATFRRRAAEAGQSLQEYLLGELTAQARRPTVNEVLERIEHRGGGGRATLAESAQFIREERDRRSADLE